MRRTALLILAATAAGLAGASFADPAPAGASLKGPKYLTIGPSGTSGATRCQTVTFAGFGAAPIIDVSTRAEG